MKKERNSEIRNLIEPYIKTVIGVMVFTLLFPFNLFSMSRAAGAAYQEQLPDTIPLGKPLSGEAMVVQDEFTTYGDSVLMRAVDTVPVIDREVFVPDTVASAVVKDRPEWEERSVVFNPDPTRAVWLSALFPGLGQIYNRRSFASSSTS